MRQLPAQITDVVTSLASGMPVWDGRYPAGRPDHR
nr:hypothetical protein [Pseudomonas aeruginosa]